MSVKRICAILMIFALSLCLAACAEEPAERPTAPSRESKPILPGFTEPANSPNDYTAVYVTVFEDLAILAAYPVLEYQQMEPECPPRELSDGGSILCGGEHEKEHPITRVLVTGQLVPKSMAGWFRDMVHLSQIDGIDKINTCHVADMNHLFAGCERLTELNIDGWDTANVTDMTGAFDDCKALASLPVWYAANNENTLD